MSLVYFEPFLTVKRNTGCVKTNDAYQSVAGPISGSDPVDPDYPKIVNTEFNQITLGGGPVCENCFDDDAVAVLGTDFEDGSNPFTGANLANTAGAGIGGTRGIAYSGGGFGEAIYTPTFGGVHGAIAFNYFLASAPGAAGPLLTLYNGATPIFRLFVDAAGVPTVQDQSGSSFGTSINAGTNFVVGAWNAVLVQFQPDNSGNPRDFDLYLGRTLRWFRHTNAAFSAYTWQTARIGFLPGNAIDTFSFTDALAPTYARHWIFGGPCFYKLGTEEASPSAPIPNVSDGYYNFNIGNRWVEYFKDRSSWSDRVAVFYPLLRETFSAGSFSSVLSLNADFSFSTSVAQAQPAAFDPTDPDPRLYASFRLEIDIALWAGFISDYIDVNGSTGGTPREFLRSDYENTWHRFRIEHQCGTVVGNWANVLSDGWVKVYLANVLTGVEELIYAVANIALYASPYFDPLVLHHQAQTFATAFQGQFGRLTNVVVCDSLACTPPNICAGIPACPTGLNLPPVAALPACATAVAVQSAYTVPGP